MRCVLGTVAFVLDPEDYAFSMKKMHALCYQTSSVKESSHISQCFATTFHIGCLIVVVLVSYIIY